MGQSLYNPSINCKDMKIDKYYVLRVIGTLMFVIPIFAHSFLKKNDMRTLLVVSGFSLLIGAALLIISSIDTFKDMAKRTKK